MKTATNTIKTYKITLNEIVDEIFKWSRILAKKKWWQSKREAIQEIQYWVGELDEYWIKRL